MGINDDSPSNSTITRTMVDAGNSNKQFLQIIVLDETGVPEVVKSINYDGTDYTPLGAISEYIQIGPQGPQGPQGVQGVPGNDGQGVPVGGSTGQVLSKIDGTDYNTEWSTPSTGVTDHGALTGLADDDHLQYLTTGRHAAIGSNPHGVDKFQVGLGNVDNTSDINKPVSTAQQAALDLKADKSNFGWISISEPSYNQSISFNTRTKIAFSGASTTLNTDGPPGATNWYNTTTGKFTPEASGDFYILRLNMIAVTNQSAKQLTLDLDIGGTQGIIWATKVQMPKSGGEQTKLSFAIPVFTLSTFIANGGEFYATMDTSGSISDISLIISRVYKR